ncbi:hypothetical protein J4H05_21960 [Enterobacter hormaechei]|uniref:hypothetical protein n=1 Tax=Enterobacter hormaechei TaxID=158836 RepID=UPI001A9F8E48|nr:hypothetical protein [Enterobacter hormaechei]MBO1456246.1 hypothetical protein [Enterobacter hormaechei]MBO1461132.1 hypothetical protein [Enterobacter hormaechei]
MMVVILTPVDGIIRWLPRGFSCSLYDWEGIFTDSYLHGTTTVIFDTSAVAIIDKIEYGSDDWHSWLSEYREKNCVLEREQKVQQAHHG